MKIRIIAVGRLKKGPIDELMQDYRKRMRFGLQMIELDHTNKANEGAELLSHIQPDDYVIIMDERGESLTSQTFADTIERLQVSGKPAITFVIGGAEGLSPEILIRANKKIAFGQQTWPHMFVRLMLVEQIYRAETILSGHPYHK